MFQQSYSKMSQLLRHFHLPVPVRPRLLRRSVKCGCRSKLPATWWKSTSTRAGRSSECTLVGYHFEHDLRESLRRFDSKDSEIQWERATAKNALKFKEKVESGEFIPDEVRRKIEEKTQRTPEEEEILRKEKESAARKEKVSFPSGQY